MRAYYTFERSDGLEPMGWVLGSDWARCAFPKKAREGGKKLLQIAITQENFGGAVHHFIVASNEAKAGLDTAHMTHRVLYDKVREFRYDGPEKVSATNAVKDTVDGIGGLQVNLREYPPYLMHTLNALSTLDVYMADVLMHSSPPDTPLFPHAHWLSYLTPFSAFSRSRMSLYVGPRKDFVRVVKWVLRQTKVSSEKTQYLIAKLKSNQKAVTDAMKGLEGMEMCEPSMSGKPQYSTGSIDFKHMWENILSKSGSARPSRCAPLKMWGNLLRELNGLVWEILKNLDNLNQELKRLGHAGWIDVAHYGEVPAEVMGDVLVRVAKRLDSSGRP